MLKSVLAKLRLSRVNTSVDLRHQVRKMEKVSVWSVEGGERMQISLFYKHQEKQTAKQVNVDRPKSEDLSKTLERLGINLTKKFFGKKKLQSLANSNATSISLTRPNSQQVEENIPNDQAWSTGSILGIQFEETFTKYEVILNPPKITLLRLPECLIAGFTVCPEIDGEFIDLNTCVFKWHRVSPETQNQEVSATPGQKTKKPRRSASNEKQEFLFEGLVYVVQNSDIGCKLKLVCVPGNSEGTGQEAEVVSKTEVIAGPGATPFEARHSLTVAATPDDSFRVVSYNILADIYADSDYSRDVLFPYCPHYALSMDYRKHLLLKEILGYNADIVCLQEVDSKVFRRDLVPALANQGYEGLLKIKSGEVREGSAIFVRSQKFRVLTQHDISLKEELKENEIHKGLWEKISQNENMKSHMEERTTVLQVVVLECVKDPNKCVIVGNTHLYFHPKANNVRLLQTFVCLHHLNHLKTIYQQQGKDATVMFCGDLNSAPLSGTVELITKGSVPSHHAAWFSGGKPLLLENIDLQHNLSLSSACGYPQYTNYSAVFHCCLDYIFIEPSNVSVERVIPLPSHDEVAEYTAIPNPVFPSDHLALVCDLKWVEDAE